MSPDLPPGRYDSPRRSSRVLVGLLAGVVAAAALIGAYSLYARHQAGRLDAELTSYDVRSDSTVRIVFQVVTRGHDGECKVRARGRDGLEVGAKILQVHATKRRTQLVTVDLQTKARAADGELVGCRRLADGGSEDSP